MSMADFLREVLNPGNEAREREAWERAQDRRLSTMMQAIREIAPLFMPRDNPPVVNVLVQGTDDAGHALALGAAHVITHASHTIELVAQRTWKEAQIIVFADLSRARVSHMFKGTDVVHDSSGDGCPVGTIRDWRPGVKLRVVVDRLLP